jgi:hypothetical protein
LRQQDQATDEKQGLQGHDHQAKAIVWPVQGQPSHYRMLVEGDLGGMALQQVAQSVEAYLATGHHYATCRRLGQLGPVQVQLVRDGWSTFQKTLVAAGQRAGDIKPTALDARHDWVKAFSA